MPGRPVLGRIGVHSPKEEKALGSNVENILRAANCDVLLSTRLEVPRLDVRAEETVRWTPEAEARMKNVPEQVKGSRAPESCGWRSRRGIR